MPSEALPLLPLARAASHVRGGRRPGAAMTGGAEDAELVAACLAGDTSAFGILVERHRRQVYQVCYRFAGNHEDASDLAQEAFLRAYRALRTFKGNAAFGTWLYRVAVNVCLNWRATRQLPTEAIDQREFPDAAADPADRTAIRNQGAAVIRAAIAKLPAKQRATMILRTYQELPHQEIADILGTSVGAVKANFFHALANLKKLLKESER